MLEADLSVDEFKLREMEAREDAELGADALNSDTFGEEAGAGWSFEANLQANERINPHLLLTKGPKKAK